MLGLSTPFTTISDRPAPGEARPRRRLPGLGDLLPGRRMACPYCYNRLRMRDIHFRCTGFRGRSGTSCPSEIDPVLQAMMGDGTPLPRVFRASGFRASGRRLRADCPTCGVTSTRRICGVCHSRLPARFGRSDTKLIALVGARHSGKSVYTAVLIHELMHGVGDRLGAAITASDDATRTAIDADYLDVLYGREQLPQATRSAGPDEGRRAPLVFRFSLTRRRFGIARPYHTLLSFFDTAGEDLISDRSVELNTRYLTNSDGVIMLLDPLRIPGARELVRPGTDLTRVDDATKLDATQPLAIQPDVERADAASDAPYQELDRITEMLRTAARRDSHVRTPVAVVCSKLDTLWHRYDAHSPVRVRASENALFDVDDSDEVHEQMRGLLREWGEGRIVRYLENNYRRFRYFGVSALGEDAATVGTERRVPERMLRPQRVAEPLLWLLSEFHAVPTNRRWWSNRRRRGWPG